MNRRILFLLPALGSIRAESVPAADQGEENLVLQTPQNPQSVQQTGVLRDIHGPLPISEYPPYLLELAIALLVIGALLLLYFFLKRRKKSQPPPIAPWDKALLELDEARQLISEGRSLLYMERASQILRRYIESRFALHSTRQTTQEFLASLQNAGDSPLTQYQAELRPCLEQADMAKFAHLIADQSHLQQMEQAVQTFIRSTRPQVPPQGGRT